MEKIKALLLKANCTPNLVDEICESLVSYRAALRESLEKDYAAKIDAAKKVCLEETEAHKREMARRLQIFCETKSTAIESQISRQSANHETNAISKLKKIHNMLEGIDLGNESNNAALEKYKLQLKKINESKNFAIEKANRQTSIAEKALKQNRQLATENQRLSLLVKERKPIASESRNRIDSQRSNGKSSTTRPTLLENQQPRRPKVEPVKANVVNTISSIADQLE